MEVVGVDHLNITADAAAIEACRAFYVDILGLSVGPRPPFASTGYWLYAGGQPLVHLTVGPPPPRGTQANALNHVAFACRGYATATERLTAAGVPFRVAGIPGGDELQLFLTDPAGIGLELQFVRGT